MAALDIVSPRIRINQDPQSLSNQPPVFGKIADETIPGSVTVLWDNMNVAVIPATALADANLDKILTPDDTTLLGQKVRHVSGSDVSLDPSGGTSREYDGKIVALYLRQPLDADPPEPVAYALVLLDDGTYKEDVLSRWVIASGEMG